VSIFKNPFHGDGSSIDDIMVISKELPIQGTEQLKTLFATSGQ
jgi:hypothetical protein